MSDLHSADTPELRAALETIGRMNRRSFLTFSAAALATLATAGMPIPVQAAEITLKSVDAAETAVFAKIAEVVLPVEGSTLAPWKPDVLLGTLDAALLSTMEPHVLAGLKGGIGYFNEGPQEKYGKTFTELNNEEATAFMDAWSDSAEVPQRALQVGLKKLIQLSYWANPESWGPTGYDGPVSDRAGFKSLGNADLPAA